MFVNNEKKNPDRKPSTKLVIPFFVTLGLLTAVSFTIPLRPTFSYEEKRELAKFPEFSLTALTSGSYFDDITTWFSDTFPGRQRWVDVSDQVKSLYGYSEITIEGSLDMAGDEIPVTMEMPPEEPEAPEAPAAETAVQEETLPPETTEASTEPTEWGGVDAGAMEINLGPAIQIGDAAFNQLRFSRQASDRYIEIISGFATLMKDQGVRVISAPCPTSIGVMVEEKYLEQLRSTPQDDMLNYLHSGMNEDVITVDMFSNLVSHNDEYIYFRTDHHWTALGAYYGYQALCWDADMEPADLDSFEPWDMGLFGGGLYGKVAKPARLRQDTLIAYIPPGDVSMNAHGEYQVEENLPVLKDMSHLPDGASYMTFLGGDKRIAEITNNSIPDAPNCVVIKDSFGNPFSIFLSQNYHKVYAIDYRKFKTSAGLSKFAEEYDIDDIIFAPYMIATQSMQGNAYWERLCK